MDGVHMVAYCTQKCSCCIFVGDDVFLWLWNEIKCILPENSSAFIPYSSYLYPPHNEVVGGYIGFTQSVCPASRVRSVSSTVQDGFFPYLVQMINRMRGCVACDDLWPWPISSRSLGLDLENRVRSVASTVLDGFFLYFAQMISIIRGCVACYAFFRIWKFEFLANF